ncbi:50S ribosome-binding GTPase [Ruaniaceae bacterium KH17]|nr:50S ribosome-binding GTPase [Ruaniaceae bacterium KH17]
MTEEPSATLRHLLTEINTLVDATEFPLTIPGSDDAVELRERLSTRIATHLLPRMGENSAPAVVVLGGSAGAGKSTLLNSVVREEVSQAGVVRPTTRTPVLVHHPSVTGHPLEAIATSVAHRAISPTMVIVDAPDLDSLSAENRRLALTLLDSADLWVFVTSAARYGDQLPWSNLIEARERGMQVAVVLNRVPKHALAAVRADLLSRLETLGLGSAPLFFIEDVSPHEGPLPQALVSEFVMWLNAAGGERQSRGLIRRTSSGVWQSVHDGLLDLAGAVDSQARAAARLGRASVASVRGPQSDLDSAIVSGELALGAPTARWLALASAGGVLEPFLTDQKVKGGTAKMERTAALAQLARECRESVVRLLVDAIQDADAGVREWWQHQGAAHLTDSVAATRQADARKIAEATIDTWMQDILGLLDAHGFEPSPRLTELVESRAVRDLVVAAAVGVPGAVQASKAHVGETIHYEALAGLREAAKRAVNEATTPFLAVIRTLPTADSATRLRVRAAELKGHIGGS